MFRYNSLRPKVGGLSKPNADAAWPSVVSQILKKLNGEDLTTENPETTESQEKKQSSKTLCLFSYLSVVSGFSVVKSSPLSRISGFL